MVHGAADGAPHAQDGHSRVSYQDIHTTIQQASIKIREEFNPDIMIAIGGGGFFPARVLRTFIVRPSLRSRLSSPAFDYKTARTATDANWRGTRGLDANLKEYSKQKSSSKKNIPIQAVGLALYDEIDGSTTAEKLGKEVIRTQWLDMTTLGARPLVGRKILIVDEVDDSRTTLEFAVKELKKDIAEQEAKFPDDQRPPTELAVFVVHNKLKEKLGSIPDDVKYFAGADVQDRWVDYPWEQQDIVAHDKLVAEQKALGIEL